MHSRYDALRGASPARELNARQRSFGANGLSRPPLLFLHTTRLAQAVGLSINWKVIVFEQPLRKFEGRAKSATDLKESELTYSATMRTASLYSARQPALCQVVAHAVLVRRSEYNAFPCPARAYVVP
jgi:hypothetical protein